MDCAKMRELLPLSAGGELEENERIALESHLSLCAECAREDSEYREVRSHLARLRGESIPPEFEGTIWEGIRRGLHTKTRRVARWDWPVRYAAILLMGLAVGFVVKIYATPKGKTPDAAVHPGGASSHASTSLARGGRADLADSGRGQSFPFEFPGTDFFLPRIREEQIPFALPRVEKVVAVGERSF